LRGSENGEARRVNSDHQVAQAQPGHAFHFPTDGTLLLNLVRLVHMVPDLERLGPLRMDMVHTQTWGMGEAHRYVSPSLYL
jgi:hypothetical protein